MHVEILSKMAPAGVLELIIMNGRTYKAAPDNTTWTGIVDDVFDIPDKPGQFRSFALQSRLVGPLPQSVILEIKLRYDNSLLAEFGNDRSRVMVWLNKVVEFAKARMALIDISVDLRVVGTVEHFDESISASDYWIEKIPRTENWGVKGPICYFCYGSGNTVLVYSLFSYNQVGEVAMPGVAGLATLMDIRSTSTKWGELHLQPEGPWLMSLDITLG